MISQTSTFDFSGIDSMIQSASSVEAIFEDAMLETAINVEQTQIPRLQVYPIQRAVHPFKWSHDPKADARARRKYFYLIKTGKVRTDSYGYVRSGAYRESWQVNVERDGDEYTITVESTMPASIYVGGTRQIPGHKTTGWIQTQPILDDISQYLDRQFFEIVRPTLV